VVESPRRDSLIAFRHLIRNKERQFKHVFALDSTSSFTDIFFLESEEFLMQYFSFVVHHDPEWFSVAIPAIVPSEIRIHRQLHFENSASDWLVVNLNV